MKRRVKDRSKFQVNLDIFKLLSILLVIVFTLFIPIFIQKLVKVTKLECESQFDSCDEVIVNNLQITGNYRDVKKAVEQRLEGDSRVNSYLIQYKIPSTLKVELNLTKPKYAIKSANGKYFLINDKNLIIEISDQTNLPTLVRNDASYKMGDLILEKDKFALSVIEKVSWLNGVNTGAIEKSELRITLKEGILVRFPLEGDVDVLVGGLRLIFSRLNAGEEGIRMEDTINISDVNEIDLRFKNPVLR